MCIRDSGCTLETGCNIDGTGFPLAPGQWRIITTQDWSATGRGVQWLLSTTRNDTTVERIRFGFSDGGHLEFGNSPVRIASGCGDGAGIVGSDVAFRVTVGSGPSPGGCVVNFDSGWVLPYSREGYRALCIANNETQDALVRAIATSTAVTIRGALATGDDIVVHCLGRMDWPE